jgi:hypothetical protein
MTKDRIEARQFLQMRLFAALGLSFVSLGCAYRLPVAAMPSTQNLKLVASAPKGYVLRLRIREPHEYRVPEDGRVTLDIPGYRAACSVYLFDRIRIRRGANPFTEKTIDVVGGGKLTRRLSLKEIAALPRDAEGYHLLTLRTAN